MDYLANLRAAMASYVGTSRLLPAPMRRRIAEICKVPEPPESLPPVLDAPLPKWWTEPPKLDGLPAFEAAADVQRYLDGAPAASGLGGAGGAGVTPERLCT